MSLILRDGRAVSVAPVHHPRFTDAEIDRTRRLHALVLKGQGMTGEQIARYFNVARRTVTRWLRDVPQDAARMVGN